jgi:tRNA threonylcarbamoyladenosine biosynthesis protein TsaB
MSPPRSAEPRLLILETSGKVGRVAIAEGPRLGDGRTLDEARRQARDLAPAISRLCAAQGWKVRELDGVLVSLGPGSYTGLRVGIMSAKTLAYASGCVVLGLPAFAAIARQAPPDATDIDVLADAQQQNVYVQRWSHAAGAWSSQPLQICPAAEWLAGLKPHIWVTGPGLPLHESRVPAANPRVPLELRDPQPARLLELGLERWRRGEADDPWTLEPLYLRASNAEENWDRRTRDKQTRRQGDAET